MGDLVYRKNLTTCDVRFRFHNIDGTNVIEFSRMNGDHFAFNDIYRKVQLLYKELPMEPEPEPEHTLRLVPDDHPLDPERSAGEWEIILRYIDATPEEGIRITANLGRQGVPVPTDVLRRVILADQNETNRMYVLSLLGSVQDFTGLEADVKTWLTTGFVSHIHNMRERPPVVPDASCLYITKGETDLQNYCQLIASLNTSKPQLLHNDAGVILPEIMEILTLRQLDVVRKPCVFLNQDGFYDDLIRLFEKMLAEKFFKPANMDLFRVANTVPEIFPQIEAAGAVTAEPKWFETR
jgi:hypothetical protein